MSDLAKIIDALKEARRYVRSNPRASEFLIENAIVAIKELATPVGIYLQRNLAIAQKYLLVEPDVAIGYISGSAFELSMLNGIQ